MGRKQTSLPSPESKQKPAEIIKYIFYLSQAIVTLRHLIKM